MPRPMRAYTVTDEDKRATLIVAGWQHQEVGGRERWWPPDVEPAGIGMALSSAYRIWRAA